MTGRYDVVVVGGGPAGSAAALGALRADPSARVLLLDRAAFPRDKPCGDGIAPHALDVLAGLGVDVPRLLDGYPPVPRLRVRSPGGVSAARVMRRPAYVVPRAAFDARLLAQAVEAGAEVRRHVVRRVAAGPASVAVDDVAVAPALVGADGAESAVRRGIGLPPNRPTCTALAIRGYAPISDDQRDEQVIVTTSQRWPAYAWRFPTAGGLANVGYGELLRNGPISRTDLLLRMAELMPDVSPDPATLRAHRLPLSTGRPRIASGNVLLAGDAQSLINPLTGEGIFYAVLSGSLAGAAAVGGDDPGSYYRRALRRALDTHLAMTSVLARASRWPSLFDAGLRAAAGDQRVFDELVELGLGRGLVSARTLAATVRRAVSP